MTVKNLVFVNRMRNGDLAVSRNFVKALIKIAKEANPEVECYYSHFRDPYLMIDIPDLYFDSEVVNRFSDGFSDQKIDGNLIINTWYCANSDAFFKDNDVSFDTLYKHFDAVAKKYFGKSILDGLEPNQNLTHLFPSYEENLIYGSHEIKEKIKSLFGDKKLILVANGQALSGHANNMDILNPAIFATAFMSKKHVILYTDAAEVKTVGGCALQFLTSEIIPKLPLEMTSDLLQHAYLSTFCDVIIGRSSGVYTYAFNQKNLFEKDTTFINFSNLKNPQWLGNDFKDKIHYKAKIISSSTSDKKEAEEIIRKVLNT